jgi:hypothetical protein
VHPHRRALPFSLGFILEEFTMGGVFGFVGVLFPDTAGYQMYPFNLLRHRILLIHPCMNSAKKVRVGSSSNST